MLQKYFHKFFAALIVLFLLSNPISLHPARAAGASLYLTPATGTFIIEDKFTVTVKVYTGGDPINAAEGVINFDKNNLEVVGISKTGSIFSMWPIEPNFSNAAGTVSFAGGIPSPGFSGQTGKIVSITFRSKTVGSTQIRFSSGAILANDGKASNILETMGNGNYIIAAKEQNNGQTPEKSSATSTGVFSPKAVVPLIKPELDSNGKEIINVEEYIKPDIRSTTHPDQNAWSKKNKLELSWEIPDGVKAISYAFNKEMDFDLKTEQKELITFKSYDNIENGIWFFHLKFYDGKKWGTADRYRVLIDNTKPVSSKIQVQQRDASNWPFLFFKAIDSLSGVSKYEIYVNSLEENRYEFAEDESQSELSVEMTQLGYGKHTALIKVFDKAGNESVETIEFEIQPIETPIIKSYPKELKSSDQFYISGTALENILVNIYIQDESGNIVKKTAHSDKNGSWFYLYDGSFKNGRHFVWAESENMNGLTSIPSEKAGFLVTPPIFATIGRFVIDYFTLFVSLLVTVILIIISILYLTGYIRKKLKKETIEVEDVLYQNMQELKKKVEEESSKLTSIKRAKDIAKESLILKSSLNESIEQTQRKILKEIKDVEDILK